MYYMQLPNTEGRPEVQDKLCKITEVLAVYKNICSPEVL